MLSKLGILARTVGCWESNLPKFINLNKSLSIKFRFKHPATSYCTLRTCDEVNGAKNLVSATNFIWLRENCQCDECYTHSTNQRHVLFHKFCADVHPSTVSSERQGKVEVTWNDGHRSTYDTQWLKDNVYPGVEHIQEKNTWDANILADVSLPMVPFKEFLNEDDGLRKMLKCLYQYGIGLVTDVPADIESTQQSAERVCFIQETFFGRMWSFSADMARHDTAYTNIALGAHTDSTYLHSAPGIQVFHCLHHDGTGGETLLVDGFHCAERLRQNDPDDYELLCRTPIHHEYKEPGVHTKSLHTILKTHPAHHHIVQLRYNHYDRSPISTLPQNQVGKYYKALRKLSALIEDPAQEFWIKLKPGTMIFVDNWRVMHGRSAFTGNRRVCGCYLPHDDWMSKARTLNIFA